MRKLKKKSNERMNQASKSMNPWRCRVLENKILWVMLVHLDPNKRDIIKFHPLASVLKMQIPRKILSGLVGFFGQGRQENLG